MPTAGEARAFKRIERANLKESILIICGNKEDAQCLFAVNRKAIQSLDIECIDRVIAPAVLMQGIIQAPGQKKPVFKEIESQKSLYKHVALVFPLEFGCPIDQAPTFGEYYGFHTIPAVPNLYAWLLADPIYFEYIRRKNRIKDFPTYNEFLSKKQAIFLNSRDKGFLLQKSSVENYDARRACMVSPSLRAFFRSIAALFNDTKLEFQFDLNKALLSNLVMEFYPSDKEIYRSLDGNTMTGEEMVKEIQSGSSIGIKYTSDLLRVSRDLLARQAAKGK